MLLTLVKSGLCNRSSITSLTHDSVISAELLLEKFDSIDGISARRMFERHGTFILLINWANKSISASKEHINHKNKQY